MQFLAHGGKVNKVKTSDQANLVTTPSRVLADFLGSGQVFSVNAFAAPVGLAVGLGAELGIFANAPDERGLCGEMPEHVFVSITAVNHDM